MMCLSRQIQAALFKTRTDGRLVWRVSKSGCVAEYGPARGDQVKGILLRHLEDTIQADIDVSSREGLHRANPRWRLDADVHRPCRFRHFDLSLGLQLFGLSSVILEDVLAGERLFEPVEELGGGIDLVIMLAIRKDGHLVQVTRRARGHS